MARKQPNSAQLATRRHRVLTLRNEGLTLEAIAALISAEFDLPNYSRPRAHDDLRHELRELSAEMALETEALRQQELETLFAIQAKAAPAAEMGDTNALMVMLRVSDRRCKLLGLDQPVAVRVESEGNRELDWLLTGLKSRLPQDDFQRILDVIEQLQAQRSMGR